VLFLGPQASCGPRQDVALHLRSLRNLRMAFYHFFRDKGPRAYPQITQIPQIGEGRRRSGDAATPEKPMALPVGTRGWQL
jgi:hypothetical protein